MTLNKAGNFGVISFKDLIEEVRNYNHPDLPDLRNGYATQRDVDIVELYKKKIKPLVDSIPDLPGWYTWVNITEPNPTAPKGKPNNYYYIGIAGIKERDKLNSRIHTYLNKKLVIFWATAYPKNDVLELHKARYKYTFSEVQGKKKYEYIPNLHQPKLGYPDELFMHAKKAPTSHLIWYAENGLTKETLDFVERALIKTYHSIANDQHNKVTSERELSQLLSQMTPQALQFYKTVSKRFDEIVKELQSK